MSYKLQVHKNIYIRMFIHTLFAVVKSYKQSECLNNKKLMKLFYILMNKHYPIKKDKNEMYQENLQCLFSEGSKYRNMHM